MFHLMAATGPANPMAAGFWKEHVQLGRVTSWTVIAMITVYLALTPDHPHAGILWAAIVAGGLVTIVIGRLPWPRLVAADLALPVLLSWSLSLVVLVVVLTLLDGGPSSPMSLVIVLPLVFAAMAYPVRATVSVGAVVVLGRLIVVVASDGFHLGHLLVEISVLVMIAVMAARIATNHGAALRRSEELAVRLGELAHVDGLTGCLNHRGFRERLDTEVAQAQREGRPVALLNADIDHFKRINDSFGHPVGDRVLQLIGETLRGLAGPRDVVARVGGEEFVLLMPGADLGAARQVAEQVRAAVGSLHEPVGVTISVGVAALPAVADDRDALVDRADHALYLAKRQGRDRVVVAARGATRGTRGVPTALGTSSVATLLQEPSAGLTSVFQPIVSLEDGQVRGYEALSRVVGSNIGPDRWLAAAEQEGCRHELELAMLDTAVATYTAAEWSARRPLFLNIGPDLLATSPLWQRRDRLPPGVVLELSERLVLSDSSLLAGAVRRWAEAGIDLAIDDLGAGYANLRAVLELQPRFVKLDRTLVRDLDRRPAHRALVGALVTFADDIGTVIVAEGVERLDELRVLADLGVPLAQGYALARPGSPPPVVRFEGATTTVVAPLATA